MRSNHGGPNFERLVDGDRLVTQLDSFDAEHDHGRIGQPDDRPYGDGVLREFWVHDPDGYTVVVASPDGESALQRPV